MTELKFAKLWHMLFTHSFETLLTVVLEFIQHKNDSSRFWKTNYYAKFWDFAVKARAHYN
mgnify:CR=1 FL=1